MMHRWNAKKNNSSAVSEILGTVLLLGISVTLFSVVYFSILTVPNTPPIPSANIICSIADGEFVFSHIGGSELSDETKILLTIPGETTTATIIAKDYMDASAKADGNWGVGEKVRYTYSSFVGREVDYSVVDIGSNAIVVTGFIPAIDPIRTFINDLLTCTGSSKTITASSTGTEPDNVTLWYKWDGYWEDTFENDDLVSSYHNMTFENGYAEVNKSGEGTDIIDYVDNQNVAVDGISDIGSHSDFSAEKAGPDDNYDILTEEYTGSTGSLLSDGFEGSPWDDNWDDTSSDWFLSNYHHSGDHSAGSWDGEEGFFTTNELNAAAASAIYIDFWYRLQYTEGADLVLEYYNGVNWDSYELGDGSEGTWNHFTEILTDSNYLISDFKIRFKSDLQGGNWKERVWIDDIKIIGLKNIFLTENFDGSFPPTGWSTNNFYRAYSSNAGGSSPEARLYWWYADSYWNDNYLQTPIMDTSSADSITFSFSTLIDWYSNPGYVYVEVSTDGGTTWNDITPWTNPVNSNIGPNKYSIDLTSYNSANMVIRFNLRVNSNGDFDYWYIDDVQLFEQMPDETNHSLNLQVNWEDIEYNLPEEYLCIKTGALSSEILYIDIWNTSTSLWDNQVIQLTENAWNNISISNWSTSSTFTIRYRADDETEDAVQNTWEIDVALLHLWEPGGTIFYEGNITSELITKPNDADWSRFYVDIDNPGNGFFKILDSSKNELMSNLNNGDLIGSISEDTIYLYGDFSGSAKLYSWKVTVDDSPWIEGGTDTISDWSWSFNFPDPATNLVRNFYFYSIGQKAGWPSESPPSSPGYDTSCTHEGE
jgi:hypothetical protein